MGKRYPPDTGFGFIVKKYRRKILSMGDAIWERQIARWQAWMGAADKPQSTIKLRTYQIRRFAAEHPSPWMVTTEDLAAWLAGQTWATETRRSFRSGLRSFYGWALAAGHMDHDPAALLPPIRSVKHRARPTPEKVMRDALEVTDDRARLIVMLAGLQGMRRGEISRTHSSDLMEDLAGWSLQVKGKGGKLRIIPLHAEVARLLQGRPHGWVFPGSIDGHLSPRWVGTLAKKAMGSGHTTHTLRHRFATVTYAGCRDLLAVQELLGHSKPETTQQYVQLPDDALRAALACAA